MGPSESLDASPKRSTRDTLVTAGITGSTGKIGLHTGLGVSMMIGSAENPAKGYYIGSEARRRLEVRDLDKAAKVASSSDDVSPFSDEVEFGPRRFFTQFLDSSRSCWITATLEIAVPLGIG